MGKEVCWFSKITGVQHLICWEAARGPQAVVGPVRGEQNEGGARQRIPHHTGSSECAARLCSEKLLHPGWRQLCHLLQGFPVCSAACK